MIIIVIIIQVKPRTVIFLFNHYYNTIIIMTATARQSLNDKIK